MKSTGLVNSRPPPVALVTAERCAAPAIAAHDVECESLLQVQGGVAAGTDSARLDQRDRDALAADGQRDVGKVVLEAKLEADVLDRVAVVVHVDFVQRVGIHREVVGAAVGVLQRDVIGDQRHVVAAAVFVAAKHVEVGPVDLGLRRDKWSFAMARGLGRRLHQQRGGACAGHQCESGRLCDHGHGCSPLEDFWFGPGRRGRPQRPRQALPG